MKHIGNTFEYERERDEDLLRAYREAIAQVAFIDLDEICRKIVKMPAKRYWISPKRASIIISAIEHGKGVGHLRPNGQRRAMDIYSRYKVLRQQFPEQPLLCLAEKVVFGPAPEFYLTPESAKIILH